MARSVHFRSIRSKLILAFLTAFIPLAVLHLVVYYRHYDSRCELLVKSQSALSGSLASAVTTYFDGIISSHDAVASTIEHGASRRTLRRHLNSICDAHPGTVSCCIISGAGELLCEYPERAVSENVVREPGVLQVMKGAALSVRVQRNRGKDDCDLVICSSVTPQGEKPVIVRSVIKANSLEGLIPSTELYGSYIAIVDAFGNPVCMSIPAREANFSKNWKTYPFIQEALKGHDNKIGSVRPEEDLSLVGYIVPMRRLGWAVAVMDTEKEVMKPVRDDFTWLIASVCVAALGMVWIFSVGNRITTPIRRLSRGAAALAVGDLRRRIEIHTGDELESLARSFNTMGESLERHNKELTDKTAALEGLFSLAQALTSSLDVDEIIKTLVVLTTDVMHAEACAIFLVDDNGMLTIRRSHNLSAEFRKTLVYKPDEGCPGKAVQLGRWVACKSIETSGDLPSRELAMNEGLASVLSAPLMTGRRALGALTIWTSIPQEFTTFQINLLCSIASYASTVIQNAELFVEEFTIAETLQTNLMSDIPQEINGLTFGSKYCPAPGGGRLGGDFYDLFELPGGKIGLVIADVSGKGLQAAIYAAKCKYMLRGTAFESPDSPSTTFNRLNDLLCHYDDSLFFVTAFYAVIDTTNWQMAYVNAGHPPPVLMTHNGKMQMMLYKTGAPLGFEMGLSYSEKSVTLDPGCGVFLYTDGIVETRGKKGMLDIEGLQDLLFGMAASEPQELAERICESATAYSDGKLRDDAAVVAFARAQDEEVVTAMFDEQTAVA